MAAHMELFSPQIIERRTPPSGDVEEAVDRVLEHYEEAGDLVMRLLALESRHPALQPFLQAGRRVHRDVTARIYAPWLVDLTDAQRRRAIDALVIATDLYTWKLLRRDMGRSREETRLAMLRLVVAALQTPWTERPAIPPANGGPPDDA